MTMQLEHLSNPELQQLIASLVLAGTTPNQLRELRIEIMRRCQISFPLRATHSIDSTAVRALAEAIRMTAADSARQQEQLSPMDIVMVLLLWTVSSEAERHGISTILRRSNTSTPTTILELSWSLLPEEELKESWMDIARSILESQSSDQRVNLALDQLRMISSRTSRPVNSDTVSSIQHELASLIHAMNKSHPQ